LESCGPVRADDLVLAEAMSDLGKKSEVIDYIETFTSNTDSFWSSAKP
jgi:hypothetical protein